MTLAKVVRKGSYQGVSQWGISTSAEITPSKATAAKWAELENAAIGRSKQAKARKLAETVSYRVAIIGIAWQGFKGTYQYSFGHEPTAEEIQRGAGDFQTVLDYETVRITLIRYTDGERRIIKITRPWEHEESIDTYCDVNGC